MTGKSGWIFLAVVLTCGGFAKSLCAKEMTSQPEKVKVLAFGGIPGTGGQPSPGELAGNVAAVDKLPIQGFAFNLTHVKGYFASRCMVPEVAYEYEELAKDIELMKRFEFKSGKKYFTRINVSAELQTDWFDDVGWDIILNNIKVGARASCEMGAVGFCLDNEQYGGQPFNYTAQSNRFTKSFDEYQAQVRKRGKQFAESLVSYMPKAKIIFLFGNSHIAGENWKKSNLDKYTMGLWPAFLDGMMDGALDAEFIDGHEDYRVRTFEQFCEVRRLIKKDGAIYSSDPARYKKRIKAASSIWLKRTEGAEYHLDSKDFNNNNYTPEEFEYAIHYAMLNSDGWIWLYAVPWLNLPEEYMNAVEAARKPHRLDYDFPNASKIKNLSELPADQRGNSEATAKNRNDCNDTIVFKAVRKVYKEVYDFPKQWKFRFDPENIGTQKQWYNEYAPQEWVNIEIGDWYGCQLNSIYTGYVWYRTTFNAPKEWTGKRLLLAFGAVDEQAWIWINGKKAGESTAGPSAWNSAFEIDISKYVQAGSENVVVVRVHNSAGPGGIWKSVKIFTE
ncbi:MAG: sugar-binding domain-containing protein [Planctomycetota bacterium]